MQTPKLTSKHSSTNAKIKTTLMSKQNQYNQNHIHKHNQKAANKNQTQTESSQPINKYKNQFQIKNNNNK